MTIYESIMKVLEAGPRTAQEIATEVGMKVSVIKIAVYTMYKRNQVTRDKKDRDPTLKGPKQEYVYARPSL